jgi:predicted ATPase
MGTIRSLSIRRFKRLETIDFDLDLAIVFVGSNNSGKSSILQALHFGIAVAQSASLISGNEWEEDVYSATFRPEQLIYTPSADVLSLGHNGKIGQAPETWTEIEIRETDERTCRIVIGSDAQGNIILRMTGKSLGKEIQDISRPYTVYAPGLAGIARQETVVSQGVIRRGVARGDANLLLRNVIFWLFQRQKEDARDWEQFQNDIRELFPTLSLRVEFTDISDEHIKVTFSLGGEAGDLPLDCAGTGILQAIQVLAYINLFRPKLLLLDEPDSHMHPNNQAAMCKLLIRLSRERGFQLLVATHSRHVFTAMKEDVPVKWVRAGALEDNVPTETTKLLLEIGALDSLDYLGHPGLRCIVFTEDFDTKNLKSLLAASGFVLAETVVAAYNGCSKFDTVKVLAKLLRDKAPNLTLIVHRDRDYLPDEEVERYTEMVTASGAECFITDFSDIEGHFLVAEHIHAAHPVISVGRAAEILDQATTQTRNASIEDIVNLRHEHALKRRARGGGNPNVGEIATQATRDFDANPQSMRRGKLVLARVRLLLQQELRGHARLDTNSSALVCARLQEIARAIWPPAAVAEHHE